MAVVIWERINKLRPQVSGMRGLLGNPGRLSPSSGTTRQGWERRFICPLPQQYK